jgi:hypothetical protein
MPIFTINGLHADAINAVGWTFTTGVEPHVQAFEMKASEADGLLKEGGEVTLLIIDEKSEKIEKLSIIGQGPSSSPLTKTVLIADLRWKWSRVHIASKYNVRRRTGSKTLLNEGLIELAQVADDFKFHPASINKEKKFTPQEVVKDVLNQLNRSGTFDYEVSTNTDSLEVNDLDLNDPGPEALALALRHLPGSSVWVDKTGKVRVQDAIGLREVGVLANTGPEIMGGGHIDKVSYRLTRPAKIIVYFVREQEIRIDSTTEGSGTTAASEARDMTNVVLVTDPEVEVNGQHMANGSWTSFDSIFPYWNATLETGSALTWSHDVIQAAFFEGGLYGCFMPFFGDENPQPIAAGRIVATKDHYRQTYQINRRLRDRFYTILPYRAAILDATTGKRGRAQAYANYACRPAQRHLDPDPTKQQVFKNVTGYNVVLSNGNVSPAIVDVLDDDAGIVRLDYTVDRFGQVWQVYPSKLVNVPTANMGDTKPRGLGIRNQFGDFPALDPDHSVAVVLTAVPAFPNSVGQFYPVEVEPSDVKGLVPGLEIEPSSGPAWEVFVGPGKVTARVAWDDAQTGTIERSFGIGLPDPASLGSPEERAAADAQAQEDAEALEKLVVNLDDLKAVAHAVAAAIWSKLSDRVIGSKTVRMDPSVEIRGSIDSYEHMVDQDGAVVTTIKLPEFLKERDPMALLPESTRRIIFREVVPK